jgi:hypothetical protein
LYSSAGKLVRLVGGRSDSLCFLQLAQVLAEAAGDWLRRRGRVRHALYHRSAHISTPDGDEEMSTKRSLNKKPRRWLRWLVRVALGLLVLLALAVVSVWVRLAREASQGRKELAAVIAEIDEKDPRWRWEEIEEDRQPIPDAENSMLVVKKVRDSFGAWKPTELKLPDGQPVYRADHPSNRRLDEQRLAVLRAELGQHEQTVALAATLKDRPRGRASVELTP